MMSEMHFENPTRRICADELRAALETRDEFLSITAHELATPLTSLRMLIEHNKRSVAQLKADPLFVKDLINSYERELTQIKTLTGLVDSLLDSTRAQVGYFMISPTNIELSRLVKEVTLSFSEQFRAAGCILELSLENELNGYWDKARLEQVLGNLLSNAIKYAPHSLIQVTTAKNAYGAVVVVKDNGPGIPKKHHEKIFERFERVNGPKKANGLGLGLFIVKQIVMAHGGRITVESDAGKGSQFAIELPFQRN